MITSIFYFSGTGNSLHVAKNLSQRIPNSRLFPIAQFLTEIKPHFAHINIKSERVGFVLPCHGLTIPVPVKLFLERVDLSGTKYLFAVVTRGGSVFRGFSLMNKTLRKQGKELNASFVINMAMNDPKLKEFKIPPIEELNSIENHVQEKLDVIQEIITHQQKYEDDVNGVTFSRFKPLNFILEHLVPYTVHHIAAKVKKYFYADSGCVGCGICEKVCPSHKIKIENDKPAWQTDIDCYLCYGCLNFCPNKAIQIYSKFYMKSYTKEKGRYPHPYARVSDMVYQKKNPRC